MAIAEERINRKKRAGGYEESLSYAMKKLNLTEKDIDLLIYSSCCENIVNSLHFDSLGEVRTDACNHHLSHALSVYQTSCFNEALILVMDAGGEVIDDQDGPEWWRLDREQQSYFIAEDDNVLLHGRDFEEPETAGIGEIYRAFTYYLGWQSSRYANRTMALSAYGNWERFKDKEIYYFDERCQMLSHMKNNPANPIIMVKELLRKYEVADILERKPKGEILQGHKDLAAWIQRETENAICKKVNYLIDETGITNVCLSGGVAYNCSAIGKLHFHTKAKNVYVHPASGDHGQCLGNAIHGYLMNQRSWKRNTIFNPYLGGDEEITKDRIEQLTFRDRFLIHEASDITGVVAKLIENREIVAWFQGKSEYGPRALGNRSILADPRDLSNKQKMNRLKGREGFMPFAPSVLAEFANDYFQCVESPYMAAAFKVKANNKDKILSVLHHDDTSRIQTVRKEFNPLFYELIYKFFCRTGIPLILNTSFNGPGEPIVETLDDALKTFIRLDIKYLAAGSLMIEKRIDKINEDILMNLSSPFFQVDFSKSDILDEMALKELLKVNFPDIQLFHRQKFLLYEEFIEWVRRGYKATTVRYRKDGIDYPVNKIMPLFPTRDFSSNSSPKEAGKVKISKFSVKKFRDLDDFDAQRDGFGRVEELKGVLSQIYGKIQVDEYVSIYNIDFI